MPERKLHILFMCISFTNLIWLGLYNGYIPPYIYRCRTSILNVMWLDVKQTSKKNIIFSRKPNWAYKKFNFNLQNNIKNWNDNNTYLSSQQQQHNNKKKTGGKKFHSMEKMHCCMKNYIFIRFSYDVKWDIFFPYIYFVQISRKI